jgi:hypothetical protein
VILLNPEMLDQIALEGANFSIQVIVKLFGSKLRGIVTLAEEFVSPQSGEVLLSVMLD